MSESADLPEGEIDPFSTREMLRWLKRQSIPLKQKQVLEEWLARFRVNENDVHASFFSSCAVFVQGIKSGEFDQKDEQGHAKLGDLEIEAADYLYDHTAEVERGPQES